MTESVITTLNIVFTAVGAVITVVHKYLGWWINVKKGNKEKRSV